MDRIILFIATGCGSGYLPKAPGTWGSLVGVLVWLGLRNLEMPQYLFVLIGLFFTGTACAGATEKIVDRGDPSLVVIDEVVGQLLALTALPLNPYAVFAGFILFRFFDISKPFPVGWLDQHIHGGLGIMLDDVAAGCYVFIILQAIIYFQVYPSL